MNIIKQFRSLAFASAICGSFGCQEQVGEPIRRAGPAVVFAPQPAPPLEPGPAIEATSVVPTGAQTPFAPADSSPQPDSGAATASAGGLCAPCERNSDCTSEGAICIVNNRTQEVHCGAPCATSVDCPNDYACAPIGDGDEFSQCVPRSQSCEPADSGAPNPTLLERHLELLNQRRAALGQDSLRLSTCLTGLAGESQDEFVSSGEHHGKFIRECRNLEGTCECFWRGQFQSEILREGKPIEDLLEHLYSEENDAWVGSSFYTRVGLVIAYDDTYLWVTSAFGD